MSETSRNLSPRPILISYHSEEQISEVSFEMNSMQNEDSAPTVSGTSGPSSLRRVAKRAIVIGCASYLGVAVLFFAIQRNILFPGGGPILMSPTWEFEDVSLSVGEWETKAWFSPVDDARGVVVMSHGNAENRSSIIPTIEMFRRLGFSTLAYDYGGYGGSTGKTSEERCYADISAMYQWLIESKDISPDKIVVYGRSVGGGPSAYLASSEEVGALILESTFASVPRVAAAHFPYLPAGILVRDKFPSLDRIRDVDAPVLIIHSPEDSLIPFHQGQALFDAAREPKTFLEIRGDHNEGFIISGSKIESAVSEFLESSL